jgi:hypothetical protein
MELPKILLMGPDAAEIEKKEHTMPRAAKGRRIDWMRVIDTLGGAQLVTPIEVYASNDRSGTIVIVPGARKTRSGTAFVQVYPRDLRATEEGAAPDHHIDAAAMMLEMYCKHTGACHLPALVSSQGVGWVGRTDWQLKRLLANGFDSDIVRSALAHDAIERSGIHGMQVTADIDRVARVADREMYDCRTTIMPDVTMDECTIMSLFSAFGWAKQDDEVATSMHVYRMQVEDLSDIITAKYFAMHKHRRPTPRHAL